MTRKHFQALADALSYTRPDEPGKEPIAYDQWQRCRNEIAGACNRFNANFDRDRFITACEA